MDISILLENAILNPDPQKRLEAEVQLQNLCKENFVMYIGLLTETLADESKKVEVRILSGISLKNELTSKDPLKKQQQASRWISLDAEAKAQIKKIALNSLLTENERVANSAAQLVAAIADIELPRQEWNELIGIIVENTKPEKPVNVKRSSLLTIGYICETADPNDPGVVSQSNGILIAIVQGAQSSETSKVVRLAAINALVDSLEFIKFNFDKEGERNYIMQVVCEATQADDVDLQIAAFGALARIMSLYYSYMKVYMEKALYGLTVSGMKSPDERVACMAVEFWSTVCENELEILIEKQEFPDSNIESFNFALVSIQDVLPVLLSLLTKQNEDAEDDSWNVAMASGACLQLFAQNTGNYIVQPCLEFVEKNISSANWREREAAVMTFGSILDGPDRDQLKLLIAQALDPILNLINDETLHVKETVSWCIGRIADLIIDAIDVEVNLPNVIQAIIFGLKDHNKVSTNCCWTLINIVEQLNADAKGAETSVMSKYYTLLVPILIEISNRPDNEYSSRTSSYEALSTLVTYSSNDVMPIINSIASEVLTRIDQTTNIKIQQINNLSSEEVLNLEELQSNILNLLTNIIRRVGAEVEPVSDNLMELFLKLLSANSSNSGSGEKSSLIEEDVLIAISSLSTAVGQKFDKYMSAFLPYLTNAINQTDSSVSVVAIGLISDIASSLQENFNKYCDGLMNLLGSLLSNANPSAKKEIKPAILSCFGDVASSIGKAFKPYLHVVFSICNEYQKLQPDNPNSIESIEYILSLRESILDTYVGIITSFNDDPDSIINYISEIFELLLIISQDSTLYNTESVAKLAVGLVGDLATMFPDGRIKQGFNQDWLTAFIKKVRTNPIFDTNTKETARWARELQKKQLAL